MSEQKQSFSTALAKVNEAYFPMIQRQLEDHGIEMDDYAKRCVVNSISAINEVLDSKGITWNDEQLDTNNITQILLSIASLKLNSSASPNEVYFQLRNVRVEKYENGKKVEKWKKQIEMGIEGDGNDAILARFGRNVKQVMKFWEVRENDKFAYPVYKGLEMSPPQWEPSGKGKVVRVVYPIIKHGDIVEYHIAEREDVIRNLIAHMNNNLMNETFGVAKNRFDATPAQKAEIQSKKNEILKRAEELGLDATIDDPELQKYISPAWKSLQSRESMIVRKMRNNIVKRIPKDFGNTLVELTYDKITKEVHENQVQQEIIEHANSEVIDIVYEPNTDNEENVEVKKDDRNQLGEIESEQDVMEEESTEDQNKAPF